MLSFEDFAVDGDGVSTIDDGAATLPCASRLVLVANPAFPWRSLL